MSSMSIRGVFEGGKNFDSLKVHFDCRPFSTIHNSVWNNHNSFQTTCGVENPETDYDNHNFDNRDMWIVMVRNSSGKTTTEFANRVIINFKPHDFPYSFLRFEGKNFGMTIRNTYGKNSRKQIRKA